MKATDLEKIALKLDEAALEAKVVKKITSEFSDFTLEDGYNVQRRILSRKLRRGEILSGYKMGMTSKAKMDQMKIHSPIHGFLTDKMAVSEGSKVSLAGRIQAKAEPEIAFIMGKELRIGATPSEIHSAIDSVAGAIEIIDSRFEAYQFELPDVVADNCSSSGYVLGHSVKWNGLDISNLGISFQVNGRPVHFGSSAAILGNPMRSLEALVATLSEREEHLPKGSVVLAGGATAAVTLEKGAWIRAEFQKLGSVEFWVDG